MKLVLWPANDVDLLLSTLSLGCLVIGQEEELSARLASAETEHACQEVTVITLKTQVN